MASTGISRITGIDPSVAIKAPCKVATTANITLSGAQTVDGVALTETTPKTRVLVRSQTSSVNNGIYDVYDTAWRRSDDYNGSRDVVDGTLVAVEEGSTFAGSFWRTDAVNPIAIGTTAITFTRTNNFDSAIMPVATFADLANTPGTPGQMVHTVGHTVAGKGGMTYVAKAGSVTNDGGHNRNSLTANVYWSAQVNPAGVSVLEFGAIGDGSTDDTVAIQAAIDYAISKSSLIVLFPAGSYKITDTITVENSLSLILAGQGERVTTLRFYNAVTDKVFFDLTAASSNTHFSDLFIDDNTPGTSTFMKFQDTLPDTDGYSHYKDSTTRCRITDFKTAILITTTTPTSGATHAFCSEPMFFHTRFKNNRVTFDVQNLQAVDITLVGTDIENDDSGEEYTFFKDSVGATYNIYGGSFVGKGIIYDCYQPVGSTSLWQAGNFSMKDSRLEMRATRTLAMFKPVASSFATEGAIVLHNVKILGFTQTLPFVNYGGRTNIVIKDSKVLAGTAVITLNPTTGITGTLNGAPENYYESFGSIKIDDSFGFSYVKATSSPYGTYEERYTVPIVVKNYMTSQNGSHSVDANNFITMASQNQQQLAVGFGHAETFRMIYNIDRPASGFTDVKFILPKYCTPMKLIMFKHPNVRATNINFQLAAVKDEAAWVTPGSFAYATDAIVLADSVTTANRMGYMEFEVNITSNYFDAGLYFKSGLGSWTEGRMILRLTSGGSMQGWAGVEYM